jgi:hypothetical protein
MRVAAPGVAVAPRRGAGAKHAPRRPVPRRAALDGEAIMELDVVTYPLPSGGVGVAAVEKARQRSTPLSFARSACLCLTRGRAAAAWRPRYAVAAAAGA